MNPELQRNVWLEFSWHRLVLMPCVLALIFLCAALGTQPDSDVGVTTTGLLLFTGLAGFWGARRAADRSPRNSAARPGTASACPRLVPGV